MRATSSSIMMPGEVIRFLLLTQFFLQSVGTLTDEREKAFATHYLREYHYLSPLRNGNHIFKDAVRMFQENAAIPDTGQLDERTIAEMTKPRCGVPDIDEDETSGRKKRFSVSGFKWNKQQLTYKFVNYASKGGLTQAQQNSIVARAFAEWQAISPLSFTDVTHNSINTDADMEISFHRLKHGPCTFQFEGTGGSLAHAFPPEDGVAHFDDDEVFTDGTSAGINLFSVALHEIGHLLGLRHSQNTSAIMYKTYKAYDPSMTLTSEERDGIEYIYAQGTAKPDIIHENCTDQFSSCTQYRPYCNDPSVGMSLRKNCPETCDQCGGEGVAQCLDKFQTDGLCKKYKNLNLCKNTFIKMNCMKTCNGTCSTRK